MTRRRLGGMLLAAMAALLPPDEAAAQQDITGLWTDDAGLWKNSIAITQDQNGDIKMRVQPGATFVADGHLDSGTLTMTHAATEGDLANDKMCKYTGPKGEEAACLKLLKDKPVFSKEKPGTVSADGDTITLHYNKWSVSKENGDNEPTITPTDVPLVLKRSLSIKVHVPLAQDPGAPLALDKTGRGVITLTNDGIDLEQGPFPAARMAVPKGRSAKAPAMTTVEAFDLENVDERVLVDSRVRGAGARNLVQIDLAKDAGLADGTVFLNVYPMVSLDGTAAQVHQTAEALKYVVPPHDAPVRPAAAAAAINLLPDEPKEPVVRLWREETQATRLGLPYAMQGNADTLYIEGLKPGRYRLVLLYAKGGATAAANATTAASLMANEAKPNDSPASGRMKLLTRGKDYDFPPDNARLTVAKVDIFQENARSHLFDVLWNGHAVIQGRVWPAGGAYLFSQQTAMPLPAHWMNIGSKNAFVALPAAWPMQPAPPAARQDVPVDVKGGFVVERGGTAVGGAVTGSGLYDARLMLIYAVEGVHLIRRAPLTILVPSAVHIADWGGLERNDQGLYVGEGSYTQIQFRITYHLLDQNGRRMRLLFDGTAKPMYGATLRMWEALGGVTRALTGMPGDQQLTVRHVDNGVPEIYWTYTDANGTQVHLGTAPRARAASFKKDKEIDEFHDNLGTIIGMGSAKSTRNFYDQQMRNTGPRPEDRARLHDGDTVLDVTQDIVCTVDNGDANAPNVRVGGTNHLEVIAPTTGPGGQHGSIGLAMVPGVLDGNHPTMVQDDHVPGNRETEALEAGFFEVMPRKNIPLIDGRSFAAPARPENPEIETGRGDDPNIARLHQHAL